MTISVLPPAEDAVRRGTSAGEKVLLLLESFAKLTAAGTRPTLTRLARSTGMAKSTTHRLLSLLVARRMVEYSEGAYRRGPALSALAEQALGLPADRLRSALLPHMVDLYELTHETVSLAVLSGNSVVLLERVHGQRNRRSSPLLPDRAPVDRTALGRAMVAPVPALAVRTAERDAPRILLSGQLRGVAVRVDGAFPGVTCLAMPVLDESRRVVAALSVSGFTHAFDMIGAAAHLRSVGSAAGLSLLTEAVQR